MQKFVVLAYILAENLLTLESERNFNDVVEVRVYKEERGWK